MRATEGKKGEERLRLESFSPDQWIACPLLCLRFLWALTTRPSHCTWEMDGVCFCVDMCVKLSYLRFGTTLSLRGHWWVFQFKFRPEHFCMYGSHMCSSTMPFHHTSVLVPACSTGGELMYRPCMVLWYGYKQAFRLSGLSLFWLIHDVTHPNSWHRTQLAENVFVFISCLLFILLFADETQFISGFIVTGVFCSVHIKV